VNVTPEYFDALGVHLVRGRPFDAHDGAPGLEHAIVNERFGEMYFPGQDPVGKRIQPVNPPGAAAAPWMTIIGVSPSIRQQPTIALHELDPVVYVPRTPVAGPVGWLLVRGTADGTAIVPLIRQQVFSLDPALSLGRIVPLEDTMAQSRWTVRVFTTMFAVFAWIAVVLAAVGLYAVTAYTVTQRTQEVGLRMALGAQRSDVIWLFVRRGMIPLAFGLSVGFAGAIAVGPLLRAFLVHTSATDPVTLAATALVLALVALMASFWPARRAACLDPVTTLRVN
jgi:putative ABC transport system permease protein